MFSTIIWAARGLRGAKVGVQPASVSWSSVICVRRSPVLAERTPDGRCTGGVGTGFTAASRCSLRAAPDEFRRETSPLDNPPPAPIARTAWWVEPVFVADIEYREIGGADAPPGSGSIGDRFGPR
ncbi:hypothetical protein [Nocardia salmonicida]|uniref:ATP dependent DNA ligase n=1 Tax=Nocardia salmonicida TaxID=53431 RepID=UPI003418604B